MKGRQIIISFNDINGVYRISENGRVTFTILPKGEEPVFIDNIIEDPLVQISCAGDSSALGFCAGETRHNSGLTMDLIYDSQDVQETSDGKKVITILKAKTGLVVKHIVFQRINSRALIVSSEVTNNSNDCVMLEALSSANISGITPYAKDEGPNRLLLHRFRSRWSAEGRHEIRTIEELLLEPSWADFGVRCEKFGAIGSMPIRGFFPFVAIEDKEAKVVWALSNACSSSWQIEVTRANKDLSVTCGLADYEFGHWRKNLNPGECFSTPEAYITAVKGEFEFACDRLLDIQRDKLLFHQKMNELPAFFNEYCTTWGEPSEDRIKRLLTVVNGQDFEYFVIDAGWYADSIKGWQDNMGDWKVAKDLFPNGMSAAVKMINQAGMKAGIWFELEVVGKDADVVENEHLLTRDGKVIISGTRRFWDMRSEWVVNYLSEKVIDFLRENNFKYIKIDYNDTIGIGCDGAESYGEGLRQSVEATKAFYRKIRENIPDIAIEICSSGGHRLEPSFMELADYLSFSDAHEEKEIPVIASNLQSLVLAQKSQIWAVLRKEDDLKRIAYSICAGMYGALCISGDVESLDSEKWLFARAGVSFYKNASPIIVHGVSKVFGPFQNSNRRLKEYQASIRYYDDKALVIIHTFEYEKIQNIVLPLNDKYRIFDIFEASDHGTTIEGKQLEIVFRESYDAVAILLEKC